MRGKTANVCILRGGFLPRNGPQEINKDMQSCGLCCLYALEWACTETVSYISLIYYTYIYSSNPPQLSIEIIFIGLRQDKKVVKIKDLYPHAVAGIEGRGFGMDLIKDSPSTVVQLGYTLQQVQLG